MALSESQLQSKIIRKITGLGWEPLKVITCNRKGWPDLSFFKDGKCFFIEVKRKNAKSSILQEYVQNLLRDEGFSVYVIDDFDQLNTIKEIRDDI